MRSTCYPGVCANPGTKQALLCNIVLSVDNVRSLTRSVITLRTYVCVCNIVSVLILHVLHFV